MTSSRQQAALSSSGNRRLTAMRRCGGVAVGLLMLVAGCGSDDRTTWTEEVLSHDGTVFRLEGEGAIRAGSLTEHRGRVIYQSYYHRPSGAYWRKAGHLAPSVFELIGGVPHVILPLRHAMTCKHFNDPANSLAVFRWSKADGWQHVALDFPTDNWRFNVLPQVFSTRDKARDVKGEVPLDKKKRLLNDTLLKDWTRENGPFCSQSGPAPITDDVMPKLDGFHSRPD